MLKVIKIFLGLCVILILSLAVALFFINDILDDNKPFIQNSFKDQLDLEIDYSSLSIVGFPFAKLRMDSASFKPKGCSEPVSAQAIEIALQLAALIWGQIEIRSFVLESPKVAISLNDGGAHLRGCKAKAASDKSSGDLSDLLHVEEVAIQDGEFEIDSNTSLRGIDLFLSNQGDKDYFFSASLDSLSSNSANFKALKLENFRVTFNESAQIAGELLVEDVAINDNTDNFSLGSLAAPVNIKQLAKGAWEAQASIEVVDFGFNDGVTKITEVRGNLNNVKFSLTSNGDVAVKLDLDANSMNLEHDAIDIFGVEQVTSPVTVKIPAGGGYEVSGPVNITGGKLKTINRNFENLSGEVRMFISGPEKLVSSDQVNYVMEATQGKLSTKFLMTAEQYEISNTQVDMGEGRVNSHISIGRKGIKSLNASLGVQTFKVVDLQPIENKKELAGVIETLELELSGKMDTLPESLSGRGDLFFKQAFMGNTNLARKVINAAKTVPTLGKLESPAEDAESQEFKSNIELANGLIHFNDARLKHRHFNLQGNASVDYQKGIEAKVDVIFLKETVSALGLGIDSLSKLFGNLAKIRVPLKISGTLPDVSISVNKGELAKRGSGLSFIERTVDKIRGE